MDRLFSSILVVLVFAFSQQVYGECDANSKSTLNQTVQGLIDDLVAAGLATQDPDTSVVTVADGKLPEMLFALCNTTSLKSAMDQIQFLVSGCLELLTAGDTKLNLLQFGGVGFSQLFGTFQSVDNFCECQSYLPVAWSLKGTMLTHTDQQAAFSPNIVDAAIVCSDSTKTAITTIAGVTGTCENAIKSQAGFETTEKKAKLQRLKTFVDNQCASYSSDNWICIVEKASTNDASNCASWARGLDQNKKACANRICVTTFIGGPCDAAQADLYIAAVNVETEAALLSTGDTCTGLDIACITYNGVSSINQQVQAIVGGLAQYVNMSTGTPVIADEDIPAIFNKLCNDSMLKTAMTEIQTQTGACVYSSLLATGLASLTIKGVGFGQFFEMFSDVDTFCQCSSGLPAAWALRADTTVRTYTDDTAAFKTVANVDNICRSPLKDLVSAVGGAGVDCKPTLKKQAGYNDDTLADFDELYGIVEDCGTNSEGDWACVKGVATNDVFKSCISVEGSKVGDSARCGRRDCIKDHMNTCTATARRLYMKAVNAENSNAIRLDDGSCAGASVLQLSMLVLATCFILLHL